MKKENFDRAKNLLTRSKELILEKQELNDLIKHYDDAITNETLHSLSISLSTLQTAPWLDFLIADSDIFELGCCCKATGRTKQELIDFCQKQGKILLEGVRDILEQARERVDKELAEL